MFGADAGEGEAALLDGLVETLYGFQVRGPVSGTPPDMTVAEVAFARLLL
jgi:hypothetical protein